MRWPAVLDTWETLCSFMQDLVLAESKAALAREAAARRKLHNLVQELRGNVRVFVRVKPADARAKGAPVLACEDGQRIACTAAGATKARCLFRIPSPSHIFILHMTHVLPPLM